MLAVALLSAVTVAAQSAPDASQKYIDHGEFAVLLLKVGAFQNELADPTQALETTKRLGLVPLDWVQGALLTHGEFADVLNTLGVAYVPNDRDEQATHGFVEAMLRRERWKLRDYLFALGVSPPPIVSPSEFRPL
jgi:hypothetical protein